MELGRERRRGRADRREGEGASRERGGAEGEGAAASWSSSSSRHRAGRRAAAAASKLELMLRAGAAFRAQFLPTGIDDLVLSACEGYQRRDAQPLRRGVGLRNMLSLFLCRGVDTFTYT